MTNSLTYPGVSYFLKLRMEAARQEVFKNAAGT